MEAGTSHLLTCEVKVNSKTISLLSISMSVLEESVLYTKAFNKSKVLVMIYDAGSLRHQKFEKYFINFVNILPVTCLTYGLRHVFKYMQRICNK